jgi:DNA polymerase-3 subunit alpha
MMARGDATGVFQFESTGMRDALRQVKPTEFEDIVALVALYRPGPMQFIPDYARNKADASRIAYEDARLAPILETTHGICIYQEQYMEIAKSLAGFSPAEADDLRKAIGKKIASLMASLKDKFTAGCEANGVPARPRTPSGRRSRWRPTMPATRPTPPVTRSSPTAPPTCARTTRPSTWRR